MGCYSQNTFGPKLTLKVKKRMFDAFSRLG